MHFQGSKSLKISNVTVQRIDQGSVEVCWETPSRDLTVSIYMGDSPVTIDWTYPAARVRGRINAKISGLDPGARYYFEVVPEGGSGVITAERLVPLEGSINFRDLGGYETSNGSQVKWGHVFRSDNLSNLTEADQALLKQMGIRLVCDFRTTSEVKRSPDRLPDDDSIDYFHLPIMHGDMDFDIAFEKMKKGDISWLTEEFMINANIKIVDEFGDIIGKILNCLVKPDARPLVFHCAGGKDRTGVCAALILLALGVPEETVIYDHSLSSVFFSERMVEINERVRSSGVDPEKIAIYFTAPRHLFVPLLDHIRETCGSPANYLRTKAAISDGTLALLKQELLE